MSMASRRSKKSKTRLIWFLLALLAPVYAMASPQGGQTQYWIRIADKQDNLAAVHDLMDGLSGEIEKDELRICMDNNEYALVHTGAADPDAAFLIREKVSQHLGAKVHTAIVHYDPAQCFSTAHFVKKAAGKTFPPMPTPAAKRQKARDSRPSVHIYPDIAGHPRKKGGRRETTDQATVLSKSMVQVLPELSTQVYLSNLDINRITCMGNRPVKDVIFSAEKGVTAKINGSNAFIKLQMHRDNSSIKPKAVEDPVELYVVCGNAGDVYTVIGVPKKIPAQWIQLVSKTGDVKKNLSLFEGKDFEKKVVTLVKQAWTGEYPDSYAIEDIDRRLTIEALEWLDITLRRTVDVEGEGFRIKEYALLVSDNAAEAHYGIREKQFVLPRLSEHPLAITLDGLIVRKETPTRLFIVERSEQEPRIGIGRPTTK